MFKAGTLVRLNKNVPCLRHLEDVSITIRAGTYGEIVRSCGQDLHVIQVLDQPYVGLSLMVKENDLTIQQNHQLN